MAFIYIIYAYLIYFALGFRFLAARDQLEEAPTWCRRNRDGKPVDEGVLRLTCRETHGHGQPGLSRMTGGGHLVIGGCQVYSQKA